MRSLTQELGLYSTLCTQVQSHGLFERVLKNTTVSDDGSPLKIGWKERTKIRVTLRCIEMGLVQCHTTNIKDK